MRRPHYGAWWEELIAHVLVVPMDWMIRLKGPDKWDGGWSQEQSDSKIPWTGPAFCPACKAVTPHVECWWAIEEELSLECQRCTDRPIALPEVG